MTTTMVRGRRAGAWLLALSPVGFVLVVGAGALTFAGSGVDDFDLITPEQMAGIRAGWILYWLVYAGTVLVGAAGIWLVGRWQGARSAMVAAALSAVAVLGLLVSRELVVGFTQPRLVEAPGTAAAVWLSLLAIWFGHAAAGLLALALRPYSVFAAVRAGARGYVLKDVGLDELTRAVTAVHRGEAILSPAVAARVAAYIGAAGKTPGPFPDLTDRERDILDLLVAGHDNAEIARRLFPSQKTVRNYMSRILGKLHVADRAQAIVKARDAGYPAG